MRQLLPTPVEAVDVYEAYRPRPPDAPLVRLNMVSSLDGAVTDERGRSSDLGGAGDREVFRVLRAHADAILVGAGTVRVEGYGPHRLRADLAARREADGRGGPAPIVVVSRSLDLDLTAPLFTEASNPTVVLTCASAPPDRAAAAGEVATVLVAGTGEVDLALGLRRLRAELGAAHVLCEGGPALNSALLGGGLAGELCVTIAPVLVDGEGPRFASHLGRRVDLAVRAVFEHDGDLLMQYRVRGA